MALKTTYTTNIEEYSVKVRYKFVGSGVLIKVDKSTIYLITAKHNFKEDENSTIDKIDIDNLSLGEIKIERDNETEFCVIEDIVYYGEPNLDLIIFSVKEVKNKNLSLLRILEHDHSLKKFPEYFFYGYPNDKNGTIITELEEPQYSQNEDEKKYKFKLNGGKQKEKHLKGFSGSGLFVNNNEDFYLVGIVIEVDDELFKYAFIDLYKIFDDINFGLEKKGKKPLLSEKLHLEEQPLTSKRKTLSEKNYNFLMKNKILISFILLLLIGIVYISSVELKEKRTYRYRGQVTKNNIGLKDIEIKNIDGEKLSKTDENGSFDFNSTIKNIRVKYRITTKEQPETRSLTVGEENELW